MRPRKVGHVSRIQKTVTFIVKTEKITAKTVGDRFFSVFQVLTRFFVGVGPWDFWTGGSGF